MFGRLGTWRLDRALARLEKRGDGPLAASARRSGLQGSIGRTFLRTTGIVTALGLILFVVLDLFDIPVTGGGRFWTASGPSVVVEFGWISVGVSLALGGMAGLMHAVHRADQARRDKADGRPGS